MELKKVTGLNSDLGGMPTGVGKATDMGKGASFAETLNKLQSGVDGTQTPGVSAKGVTGLGLAPENFPQIQKPSTKNGFATDMFPAVDKPASAADPVKFSNHAVERMMSRGIKFSPEDVAKLNEAVGRAAAKGSKDSLILMNDSALIVSVKNKTVVTVMDKNALKENVFTNIDSTIVM